MATRKKQAKEPADVSPVPQKVEEGRDTWKHPGGKVIRLKEPDLVFLEMVYNSVKIPDPPTYDVPIFGGGTQTHRMDADFVQNHADDEQKQEWMEYLINLGTAISEQTTRVLRAVFLEGTEIDDVDDPRWLRRMQLVGMPIPPDRTERWLFYLTTSLSKTEARELSDKIVAYSGGPPSEMVQAAVDSFRDPVREQA